MTDLEQAELRAELEDLLKRYRAQFVTIETSANSLADGRTSLAFDVSFDIIPD